MFVTCLFIFCSSVYFCLFASTLFFSYRLVSLLLSRFPLSLTPPSPLSYPSPPFPLPPLLSCFILMTFYASLRKNFYTFTVCSELFSFTFFSCLSFFLPFLFLLHVKKYVCLFLASLLFSFSIEK